MKDVKVTVIESKCNRMNVGDYFIVKGDKIHAPFEQGICFYSLSAMTPALAPWQMDSEKNDHYIIGLKKFSCPMRSVMYQAESFDSLDLKNHK